MTATDDDEMTELLDANFPRVDLVGKGANGIPRFLIAKQDGASGGLVDPEFIRDLIAKSEPGQTGRERVEMPSGVTLTGSPADIAAFIHKAAVRAAEPGDVAKAEISTADKNDLPDSAFGYIEPGGKKDESGKTTPRSLRHFPIQDAAHVRNALARIAQGAEFGDKASGKVHAAAKKFGIDVSKEMAMPDTVTKDMGPDLDDGVDGLDPTVPLAAPDEMAPGDPTDPGSPAWESIDAATAQKWTSIAVRLKNALSVLSDRELLEAATADPDDAGNAWDLQDAMCAVDYVISTLAVFAAGEQAEADLCGEAMDAIGKSLGGFDTGSLDVIEGLTAIRKAGRVLSAANEAKIRQAAQSLGEVLASLPQAPDSGQSAAVTKEGAMPATPTDPVAKDSAASPDDQARDTGPVNAGGTTGLGQPRVTGPAAALPGDGPQEALPGDPPGRQVIKAAALKAVVYDRAGRECKVDPAAIRTSIAKDGGDGDAAPALQAVFDENGDLIGVVDPAQIQPVAGAGGRKDDVPDGATGSDATDGDGSGGAGDGDLTPQPAADAGTPSQDVQPDGTVAKAGEITSDILKSIAEQAVQKALETQSATHAEVVAKMAADKAEQAEEIQALKSRLEQVENTPAAPKVFANGAAPPSGARPALRGQDEGATVDVAKAAELRETLYKGSGPEQAAAFNEMQNMAIAEFTRLRGNPQSPARA